MIRTLSLIGACLALACSPAFAKRTYQPAPRAVVFKQGSAFNDRIIAKKQAGDTWQFTIVGTNVTSGERLEAYANLRVAAHAVSKGFSHFTFTPTKKWVMCRNRLMGQNVAAPLVTGTAVFAKSGKSGLADARAFIAQHGAALSVDADRDEKAAVLADWSSRCP